MQIVECVPNFSEGRNQDTIEAIAQSIRTTQGVELLDVDPGADTNRTVVTFIGPPEAVLEAAFQSIRTAVERIDMRLHTGAHARMGACDVCPFVPVKGVTMEECSELARQLGKRVGDQLGVPVYLYESAASRPERVNLAQVRKGEYEGLEKKLTDPQWKPDFGPSKFVPRSGAITIGSREFLIAYNFNLNTKDRKIAHDIALEIREAGRALRDANGKIIRDENNKPKKKPGMFKHVKAVGWVMEDFGCAQVTMNLTDYKKTPLAEVFDAVCNLATQRGVRVTGSELVGLIPEECLVQAGKHFFTKAGKSPGQPRSELVRMAIQSMGLNELYAFKPEVKIIERRIPSRDPLVSMSLREFADETSTDSTAPGGGSVAAACGALSAALAAMAANVTVGRKDYSGVWDEMKTLAQKAQDLKDRLLAAVDEDTRAYNSVVNAMRMPKKTEEQKAARSEAIQQSMIHATLVPFGVLESMQEVLELTQAVVDRANPNALSDAGVSALCARTSAESAYYNVLINLARVDDKKFVEETNNRAMWIWDSVHRKTDHISSQVRERLLADAKG